MAKNKATKEVKDEESVESVLHENAFQAEPVKVTNPSHLMPQAEMSQPPARPEAVDPSHLKPMAEVKEEAKIIKPVKPEHAKPQE